MTEKVNPNDRKQNNENFADVARLFHRDVWIRELICSNLINIVNSGIKIEIISFDTKMLLMHADLLVDVVAVSYSSIALWWCLLHEIAHSTACS